MKKRVRCFICDKEHPKNILCGEFEEHCIDCGKGLKSTELWTHYGKTPLCKECWQKERTKGME